MLPVLLEGVFMSKTIKLEFVRDAVYDGKIVHHFGAVEDVSTEGGYADRWIKRGVAITVDSKPVPKAVVKKVEPKKAAKKEVKDEDSVREVVESEEVSGKNNSKVEASDIDFDL